MRAVLADTGPLYALADPSDQYHQRAAEESQKLHSESLRVSVAYPTVLETHSLILKRLGVRFGQRWLQEVMKGADLLNPVADDYLHAVDRLRAYRDQPFTLHDCVVAELSATLEIPVWTFDRHFDTMRVAVWWGLTP